MERKAFVLLSGGLDSTTALFKAIYDFKPDNLGLDFGYGDADLLQASLLMAKRGDIIIPWVEAVSINYGQRHAKEMEFAHNTCERLGIKHSVIELPAALQDVNTMLTQKDIEIPNVSYGDLPEGVSPTYVPFRNGTMLSILAAHAQKWINAQNKIAGELDKKPSAGIYFGAHAEDAHNWAYPDCTPEFIGAMANAIYVGTYHQVRLYTPLMTMMKSDIVTLGESLGVLFEDTWSCYKGEELHCGICPTCRSRRQAFLDAGVTDPTIYANPLPGDRPLPGEG
jgi:7-cyano-7-deazaguanine synthase